MKRPLLPLFAVLAALIFAAPSFAQYTSGGNDETSEDLTVAASWAATAVATPGIVAGAVTGTHLLITEVGMRGLNGATLASADSSEFLEIYNPTGAVIDLSKFYVSDVNAYSTLPVAGTVDLAANNTDFAFRFPAGATIAPGQVKVIAIDGGRFKRAAGIDADFMLFNAGGATTAQLMVDVGTNKGGVYPGFGSFTNGGEFVWLFFWNGACDLTVDVDLVYWPLAPAAGANAPVRKLTTTCQDGPDAGGATSCFFNDAGNPAGSFGRGLTVPANGAGTRQRIGAESEAITSGGNGIAPLAATSTSVASDNNPSSSGGKVNFTAAIVPAAATGTVEFFDGITSLGTAPVAAGSATLSVSTLSVGSHQITAVYSGDCSFASSTSAPLKQDVNAVLASTTTTLIASSTTTACGEKLTLTANVVQTTPPVGPVTTGTVDFYDGANLIGSSGLDALGNAILSISTLAPGLHSLSAIYSGDANHAGSVSNSVPHDVVPALSITTLTQSSATTVCGEKFTLTATVTGAPNPSGDMEFFDGATSLGIVTVDNNGVATLSVSSLAFGSHSLTAHYHSDPCNSKSDSNKLLHDVTAAPTSVTLDAAPKLPCGQDLFLEASTAVNAGTIDFYDGATLLGSVPFNGSGASVTLLVPGGLSPGVHSLTATLTPADPCFAPSTSNKVVHEVNPASTTTALDSSPNPSECGEKVTLTANVFIGSPGLVVNAVGPEGEVNFFDGATPIGSATLVDGVATLSTTFVSGSHSLTAVYKGSPCTAGSTSGKLVQEVTGIPTSLQLAAFPNPTTCGGKVVLQATLNTTAASGEVNFFDGANQIASAPLINGVAFGSAFLFEGGSHSLIAVYKGDGCYAPSTSNKTIHQVDPNLTAITLTSDPNPSSTTDKVTLTASVLPDSSTGEVNFFDNAAQIGSAILVDGVATLSVTNFTAGTHSLTAVYKGDPCHAPSSSNKIVQVVDDITPVQLTQFRAEPLAGGVELRWQLSDARSIATVDVERSTSEAGPWSGVTANVRFEGDVSVATDLSAAAGQTYWYRLVVTMNAGGKSTFGPVTGTAGVAVTEFALARVAPNPSFGMTTIDYTVARASNVRLSVVDLQGREVALLVSGNLAPGRYHASWNGRTERGAAPAGLYFIRYQTAGKNLMHKLVLNR